MVIKTGKNMVTTISETTKLWKRALEAINQKLEEKKTFDEFFRDSYIQDISGNVITVVGRNSVAKALFQGKYNNLITSVVNDLTNDTYILNFVSVSDLSNAKAPVESKKESKKVSNSQSEYFNNSTIKSDLTFDNFVVGDFNKEAHKAALYVARNGGTMFNPLFIYSQSGLGKTHLLHAIANDILKNRMPDAKILYITAQDFVEEYIRFVTAEKSGNSSIKDYFKDFDILLLDDVQFLANKVKTEEVFFYVYQDMINKGKRVIITSDRQPNELKGLEDRLISRFNQGLTVKIKDLDKNTCVEILKSKIKNSSIDFDKISPEVISYFADNFSNNVRELEGALNRLIFNSLELEPGQQIDLEFASRSVESILGNSDPSGRVSAQKIINIVSDYYNITPSQITGKTRTGQIALARHVSMYLIKNNTDLSLKKIGDLFGGKDHTTVMSGIKKVENELETNKQLQIAIAELEKLINE